MYVHTLLGYIFRGAQQLSPDMLQSKWLDTRPITKPFMVLCDIRGIEGISCASILTCSFPFKVMSPHSSHLQL